VQSRCLHARNVLENGVYRCADCGFEKEAPSSAAETENPEVVEAVRRAIAESCGLNVIHKTAEAAIRAYNATV